jgi:hypothetical protein
MFSGKRNGCRSYGLEEIDSDKEELLPKPSVADTGELEKKIKTVNVHIKVVGRNSETERLLPKASVTDHVLLERNIKAEELVKGQVKVVEDLSTSDAEEMSQARAWELLWLQSAQYPIWWYM